jgi:REP element-mobilizing transposase RayT
LILAIPTGLQQLAQGWPIQRGLPWVAALATINAESVASPASFAHGQIMPQSLSRILVHTVFSTKGRQPFLRDRLLREELHRYVGGILANLGCQPLLVGGVEDHVHILSTLLRTCESAEMVKEVKRGSSQWLKTKGPEFREFGWQNGYGIFSIGHSQVEVTRQYIARQEEHHKRVSFQDEFRELLRRYEIEFDERYVWD